jgi:hypothetical protein
MAGKSEGWLKQLGLAAKEKISIATLMRHKVPKEKSK